MIVLAPLAARAAGTGGVGGGGGGLGGGSTRGISWQDCSLYMCPAGGVARRAAAVISEVQQQDGDRYTYSSTCNMQHALAGRWYAWPGASWRYWVALEWVFVSLSTDCWPLAFALQSKVR